MIAATDLFCLYSVPTGTVAALRGLSLGVEAGERLVVHGPNGSGKTTLLRVLMGEQPPSAGTVRVAGVELSGADDRTRAQLRLSELGVVDQHPARSLRPELDVLDNVALQSRLAGLSRRAARARAGAALERLALAHLAARSPATLAGGEAQRVAVCAAIAHGPSVVLADEPTGDLDADAADEVYDLLAAAAEASGAALVLVTHDERAARVATRVVRIRDGRLSEQWSPDAPEDELLVVDDRGWVRLPERLREFTRTHHRVRAAALDGQIVLRAASSGFERPVTRPVRAEVVPGDVVASGHGVSVRYGSRTVLREVDVEVCGGVLTVVRGPSGSGKTTLLRVLLGLADPDSGRAVLAGTDVGRLRRVARADLRRSASASALQGGALAETLDVGENLALARTVRGLPVDTPRTDHLVERLGLTPVRGRQVRLLSGGERQRVAVARCLAVDQSLVVLDEPTSQQDEAHAELVADVLLEATADGSAVLAATHDPVLVGAAGRVLDLG